MQRLRDPAREILCAFDVLVLERPKPDYYIAFLLFLNQVIRRALRLCRLQRISIEDVGLAARHVIEGPGTAIGASASDENGIPVIGIRNLVKAWATVELPEMENRTVSSSRCSKLRRVN